MCSEPSRRPHILIVEDEPSIEFLIKTIIAKQGQWKTTSVVDGSQAVKSWRKGDHDVIIMDIKMANMDGIKATKVIRRKEKLTGRKRTPIVAFTGYADERTRQECFDAGVDEFIPKPVKMEVLLRTIKRFLSSADL